MMLRVHHDCEIDVGQDDILFFPGRGPIRKMLDFVRRAFMASHKSPSARKFLKSNFAIIYEKRRHLRNFKKVIHPFSLFRHWWNIMMIIVMSICLLLFPYQSAFKITQITRSWTVTKNILCLVCCSDILVNLMTGYFDATQRSVVMETGRRIRRYFYPGTMIPDILGSFPTDLFFLPMWNQMIVARELCSLLVIFRIFSIRCYIHNIFISYNVRRGCYGLFTLAFWAIVLIHWQACMFWIVPFAVASLSTPKPPQEGSWIHFFNLWEKSYIEKYFFCFTRVVATFARCEVQKEEAHTSEDQYLMIVFQLMSTLIFCILIVRFMQHIQGSNSSRLRYQAASAQLRQYMSHKQLPRRSQERFIAYYEFRFQHWYFQEGEIIHTITNQMRQEIGMHSCRKLIENVPFFSNLPLALLARIVTLLKSEVFLTNDLIVRADTPGDCMYFIASGTVAIYTPSGKEVCHLEDGAHFGEIALVMPDEKRIASVVAVEICELYRLERSDFSRTIQPYPMLWERIKKIAMERHEKTIILNAQ